MVDVYNSSIPGRQVTADLEPVSVASREGWFNEHDPASRPLWIVEAGNQRAGWMSFSSFYGRPAYNGTVEVSIYLSENFTGRGIGQLCIEKAVHTAKDLSIHTLLGFIFGHNKVSLNLFLKNGFEIWGSLPGVAVMDGSERDLVIAGRKLTDFTAGRKE